VGPCSSRVGGAIVSEFEGAATDCDAVADVDFAAHQHGVGTAGLVEGHEVRIRAGFDRTLSGQAQQASRIRRESRQHLLERQTGGQQLTEEIMRTYGLSLEDAGRAKKEGGLPGNYEPEVLVPFIDDMTQQVSRSLQFFLASGSGREQPDQILVCGGCANIPGVADVIGSRVGIPTEIGDPLGQMKISGKAKAQGVRSDATALLTACGLALRSFD